MPGDALGVQIVQPHDGLAEPFVPGEIGGHGDPLAGVGDDPLGGHRVARLTDTVRRGRFEAHAVRQQENHAIL